MVFRAPEVLFKHGMQSRAIDIWSVGVIYLCLLNPTIPFFNSPDDQDALVEIACIVGTNSLEKVASLAIELGSTLYQMFPLNMLGLKQL